MSEEMDDRVAEVDRLLNDPDVPMSATRVWELLEQIKRAFETPTRSTRCLTAARSRIA